ncbi:protein FREE1-like [Lolium rigidum]|uniref:protein FREE1-like n=1 Tax=Lolium rigidum TaxID=89674 RepID=UPI001F5D59B6|nr:protein FREE1-like [Lolium rigidum]
MQHGSGDYAASAPAAGGHYYPHQYAPPPPNPYPPAADAPAGYASAPPYSAAPYPDHPPSAPAYSQPPHYAGYPPYNPAPYPPEPSPSPAAPYYPYPQPTHTHPTPPTEPSPTLYDAPYYGGAYQHPQPAAAADDYLDEGAYAYTGDGGAEPYGARGTAPARSGAAMFDDYGRSIGLSSGGAGQPQGGGGGGGSVGGGGFGKIARAVPKAESHEDAGGGAQKFRVKLLPEGAGIPTDVLCQVGLDGIRMLEPSTNRTLRIYPLDTLTKWEILDSTVFAIWAKTSVDFEPKRIRLKSSSYTSNTLLDTVTAATVQFKEIGEDARANGTVDAGKSSVQSNEKKKGFDWMFAKPVDEVKDHWVPDEAAKKCQSCAGDFSHFNRRHHCRNCGEVFCDKCSQGRIALTTDDNAPLVRVCDRCMAEVSQRLSMAQEAAKRSATVQSHGDLAKKLKEELERNRKSSGSASGGVSGTRMREVACPTCTVHLQVEVPTSGSETVECGVCQHAFLVSAN